MYIVRITYFWLIYFAVIILSSFPSQSAPPKHLVLIVMENQSTDGIVGNRKDAPFINDLIGQNGVILATQYYGVTHPSLPNYLALASGDYQGINDDCKAGADVYCKPVEFTIGFGTGPMMTDDQEKIASTTRHLFTVKTFLDQLEETGHSWKVYMQDIPNLKKMAEYAPLDDKGNIVAKLYAQKHNPFLYFSGFQNNTSRLEKIMPLEGFFNELKLDSLAEFTWISPNQCNDMHGLIESEAAAIGNFDCAFPKTGIGHSIIKLGDTFLQETVNAIRASSSGKNTSIIIVWDEDDYSGSEGIKGSPVGRNGVLLGGSRTPLIVVNPSETAPRILSIPYNHYNLLASIEDAYGVGCLIHACDAKNDLIRELFH